MVCHFLLQGIFLTQGSNPGLLHCRWILNHWASREALHHEVKSLSCIWLCYPVEYSPPGSSVHGVFQARILSGLPFPSPRIISNLDLNAQQALIPRLKCLICIQNVWEKQHYQTDDSVLNYSNKYFMNYFLFWSNHKDKLQEQYREFFSRTIWEQVADLVPHHFWIFQCAFLQTRIFSYITTIHPSMSWN